MKFKAGQKVRAVVTVIDEKSRELFPEGRIGTVETIQERHFPLVFVRSDFASQPVGCYPEEIEAVVEASAPGAQP